MFDNKKALKVFRILDREWRAQKDVFENIVLPQDRLKFSRDANFLFYAALFMRGGIISEDPFRWICVLYDENPEYFDPNYIVDEGIEEADLQKAFLKITPKVLAQNGHVYGRKENGSGNPFAYKIDQHTKAWITNSYFLVDKWNGNILKVFKGVKDFEEAFARVNLKDKKRNGGHGILGMRRKIFSLLTIWLQEKNLIPHFPTPIPVDFHALRILWITGILNLPDLKPFEINLDHPISYDGKIAVRMREDFVDEVTKWSQNFLHKSKISHLVINPALWVLSRDLCSRHFQNSSAKEGTVLREPEKFYSGKISWPRMYTDPCSACPIEQYCHGVVPAAPYYIWGILMKMDRVPFNLQPLQTQTVLPGLGFKEKHPVFARFKRRSEKK
ncbi:MAG TPA: hypothetical protein PLB52_00410 [Candidatus Moranbacteria bacterium]|nr:hypothetical protein [Candidatus Moranbacteria bacterium]